MKFYYEIIFQIDQLFHCLKGKVDNENLIMGFLDKVKDYFTLQQDKDKVDVLRNYYFQ